jgi:FKBP-type peptidyl-prolyl cis-trans isomerase
VPAGLTPDLHKASPLLGAGSDTVWQLEVVSVNDVPKFRRPADDAKKTTESGLIYEVIREGEGESPAATDKVKVHYTGWLLDGTTFDSSHARGEPISFALNRVIKGWTEGVGLMKPGAIYLFEIPSDLAYGANPRPGGPIPPNATLVFLVELIAVQ